jgi:hypothetical protein
MINVMFSEGAERNRALGVWAGAGAAGLVIGVLLGGRSRVRSGGERCFS